MVTYLNLLAQMLALITVGVLVIGETYGLIVGLVAWGVWTALTWRYQARRDYTEW